MNATVRLASALALFVALPLCSVAQTWPAKPVKVIVGFPPSGAVDLLARTLVRALEGELGQPVLVENRPGAAQTLGVDALAAAAPDGYTIGLVDSGPITISPHLRALSYDPFKAIVPVGSIVNLPLAILSSTTTSLATLRDVEEQARKAPGSLSYGSAGTGSIHHLIGESLKTERRLDILHVPYRGMAPAVPDLISGRIALMLTTAGSGGAMVKKNQARAIAVTSAKRSGALPDTPTLDEQGVKGFDAQGWVGLFAPVGVSPQIIATLGTALQRSLQSPELVRQEVDRNHNELLRGTPDELGAMLRKDYDRWGKIIRDQGIRAE